ncbi:hypothetical protein ACHAQA_000373 [Verticillium albo-atrum]
MAYANDDVAKLKEPSAFRGFISVAIVAAIASGIAVAMVNVVMAEFIKLLGNFTLSGPLDRGFMNSVSTTALYFVYIGVIRFVTTYLYASLFTYTAYHLVQNIQRTYLRSAFSQEIDYYDSGTSGSISMQATSNGLLIQAGVSEKVGLFIQSVTTFLAAFIIAFLFQWKLTLILICIIPAIMIIVGGAGAVDAATNPGIFKIYADAASYAENVLTGVRTVHAFGLRSRVIATYESSLQVAYEKGMKKSIVFGIQFGGQYFVIYSGMGLAFWQGFAMIGRGEVSDLSQVFVVLFSVIIAASTIMQLGPHIVSFGRAASAAVEMFRLIDRTSQIDAFDISGCKPETVKGYLDLQGINFSYPSRPDVSVLNDFSLHIPAGKVTALVGPSGTGKSTIIGLLERWYSPTAGSIMLDGTDIEDLNVRWLRTNIRLVQQEPVLFNGTVFENIANGLVATPWEDDVPAAQKERVISAAKLAHAHDFITQLPQGYETRVGERGGLLSGGQKQRVAIARSIIAQPKILLLDEATSALDPQAEGIVQQALDNASRDRTTIVVAHKLATIRKADNIIVMDHGKIAEQGNHQELLALNQIYARLVKAQGLSVAERDDKESSISEAEDLSMETADHGHELKKLRTIDAQNLALLKERENHDKYSKSGIVWSIWKLVRSTPQLMPWYLLSISACVGGGESFIPLPNPHELILEAAVNPGQTLLLGEMMGLFGTSDMASQANFIALMFFVLAIGALACYFALGWSMNVIAQVGCPITSQGNS